jgi:hypothetical protein
MVLITTITRNIISSKGDPNDRDNLYFGGVYPLVLAAFGVGGRFNLIAAGLACLVLGVWLLPLV